MVRESVYQDLRDTLIRCQWLEGTTSDGVTTTAEETLALLEGRPLNLIDYFPESDGAPAETLYNTFAMDIGDHGEMVEGELGGFLEQPYTFNMAFYALTDAVAMAVMSDLYDRYLGITESPFISLYNYLADPPNVVVRMEVENFRYARDITQVAPHEVHLFFASLEITDYVDQARRTVV
jgi:hypothetical protein